MVNKKLIGVCTALVLAGSAYAGPISTTPYFEAEFNNVLPGNFVGAFTAPGGAALMDGAIGPGDVDWYYFFIPGPGNIVAAVYGLPNSFVGDSTLQIWDLGAGAELTFDDDDNIGFFSSAEAAIPAAGFYAVGVSGYADGVLFATPLDGIDDFTGLPHTQAFPYKLTVGVNAIPEPATLSLLGLGALALIRRRR